MRQDNDQRQGDRVSRADNSRSVAQLLIADDDPEALELLEEVLRPLAVRFYRAESGAELATLLAEQGPFDLIVTDIDMPWVEGLGVMRSARAAHIDTPVLFVSGIARPDLEKSVAGLRDATILRKPVGVATLRNAVRDMLAGWETRRLRQRQATPRKDMGRPDR